MIFVPFSFDTKNVSVPKTSNQSSDDFRQICRFMKTTNNKNSNNNSKISTTSSYMLAVKPLKGKFFGVILVDDSGIGCGN